MPARPWFTILLSLGVARAIVALVAIPLVPFLYAEHFVVLVLMRPTKEVLLAAGFFIRETDLTLGPVVAAAIPLAIFGVWHFYLLGRLFGPRLVAGDVPAWADRFIPHSRIRQVQQVLKHRGSGLVFLSRIAVFPSTLTATAAGSVSLRASKFLPADLAGATLSIGAMLTIGYVLGYTYDQAGPWITAAGATALIIMLTVIARTLRRGSVMAADDEPSPERDHPD